MSDVPAYLRGARPPALPEPAPDVVAVWCGDDLLFAAPSGGVAALAWAHRTRREERAGKRTVVVIEIPPSGTERAAPGGSA